jgi:hypothetical protein
MTSQKVRDTMSNEMSDYIREHEEEDIRACRGAWDVDKLLDVVTKESSRLRQRTERQKGTEAKATAKAEEEDKQIDSKDMMQQIKEVVAATVTHQMEKLETESLTRHNEAGQIIEIEGRAYQIVGVPEPAMHNTPGYAYKPGMSRPFRPFYNQQAASQPPPPRGDVPEYRFLPQRKYYNPGQNQGTSYAQRGRGNRPEEGIPGGNQVMRLEGRTYEVEEVIAHDPTSIQMAELEGMNQDEILYHIAEKQRMPLVQPESDVPMNWEESPHRGDFRGIPRLANVSPDECAKCGMNSPVHRYTSKVCPIYSIMLKDRPCQGCGKGLHTMDNCLRSKMSTHVHPADKPKN